jgi:phosphatidylinositol-3-phosphatase
VSGGKIEGRILARLPAGVVVTALGAALFLAAAGRSTSSSMVVTPDADAYVTAASPKANFGSAAALSVAASPDTRSYLRFSVQGLVGAVRQATLRLYASSGSNAGVDVRTVADSTWGEKGITYSNAPAVSSVTAGSSGAVSAGVWLSIDVTALVRTNGVLSLAITSKSTLVAFGSRESANKPQLVVDMSAADTTPPMVSLTSPLNGSTSGSSTPVFSGALGSAMGDLPSVSVRVYAGSSISGTPVETLSAVVGSGGYQVAASPGLANGVYTAQAQQLDSAGNLGVSAANTFRVATVSASTYRAIVLADGAIGYWRLGETSGLSAMDLAGSSPGSYFGSILFGIPGGISGDSNSAVRLDGLTGTVRVANTGVLNATATLTLEAWVKPASLPGTSTVLRKDGQYLLRIYNTGSVVFRLWKGGAIYELTAPPGVVNLGVWSHLVATYDGSTMTVYVNGTARAAKALIGPIDTSANGLYLGSSLNSYDYFPGSLDEVAVYPTALAAARVQAHYAVGIGPDATPPRVNLLSPVGGSTATANPVFSGTAGSDVGDLPSVSVRVFAGSSVSGTSAEALSAAVSSGSYQVAASPALADGVYTAQAQQIDSAGNVGTSGANTFTVRTSSSTPLCGFKTSRPETYSHVIVMMLENKSFGDIIGNTTGAPFENQLASQCGVATNYHGVAHPSLPNYLATVSGSTQEVVADGNQAQWQITAPTLFSQVPSWRAYEESMATDCEISDSYPYQSYHNPPTYFIPLTSACPLHDVPMGTTSSGAFATDLQNETLPAFAWVTPNQMDNMHDGTIAQGDSWLQAWINTIAASPSYQAGNTVLIVTWDEDDGTIENHIPTFVMSPYTQPGTKSDAYFDHYSLLRTAEDLLGVTSYLGNAATASSMRTAFGL